MRIVLFLLLSTIFTDMASGQKFLQLERIHSPKTRKYYPGYEITFQMNGGQWYTRVIEDVSYEENWILFAKEHVSLDSIMAFRSFNNQKWSRPLGNQLVNFAVAWTGFALIADAVSNDAGDNYTLRKDGWIAGTSALAGFALKNLFKKRTFHLNKDKDGNAKKWRLRVLDLNVKKKPSG